MLYIKSGMVAFLVIITPAAPQSTLGWKKFGYFKYSLFLTLQAVMLCKELNLKSRLQNYVS